MELQGTALTNGKKYGILYELTILTGGSRGSGIEVVITGLTRNFGGICEFRPPDSP